MPKAYLVSAYNAINDPDKLKAYAELAGPAVSSFGGNFLARGANLACYEGKEKLRAVVIEFESMDRAKECHDSEAYKEALANLEGGAVDRDLFIIEGAE